MKRGVELSADVQRRRHRYWYRRTADAARSLNILKIYLSEKFCITLKDLRSSKPGKGTFQSDKRNTLPASKVTGKPAWSKCCMISCKHGSFFQASNNDGFGRYAGERL